MTDDPTGVYLTEFFNRSVTKVWSTDGTAPGPGAILTPDLLEPGRHADAVTRDRVRDHDERGRAQAPVVTRVGPYVLYRVGGEPLKLASGLAGIDRDGWMADTNADGVAEAAYNRFDVSRDGSGFAQVLLNRVAWCPDKDTPAQATVRVGPIGLAPTTSRRSPRSRVHRQRP